MQARPVSDLQNNLADIENIVKLGQPVYLTQDGHGAMVLLSFDSYSRLTESVEYALDEADLAAAVDSRRLTHEEVFEGIRRRINAQNRL